MLGEFELLLTDEFEGFAAEIAKIHAAKKTKAAEFKQLYENFQKEIAALDAEAKKLYEEWQASTAKEKEKKAQKKPQQAQA